MYGLEPSCVTLIERRLVTHHLNWNTHASICRSIQHMPGSRRQHRGGPAAYIFYVFRWHDDDAHFIINSKCPKLVATCVAWNKESGSNVWCARVSGCSNKTNTQTSRTRRGIAYLHIPYTYILYTNGNMCCCCSPSVWGLGLVGRRSSCRVLAITGHHIAALLVQRFRTHVKCVN